MIKDPIRANARLIRPKDIPEVMGLLSFIQELDQKYGTNSVSQDRKDGFGHLDMEKPLVSYMYESNIYYLLKVNDITRLPVLGMRRILPMNRILHAGTQYGTPAPDALSEEDKAELYSLRQRAKDALVSHYPEKPVFKETDTNITAFDARLQEQGFADGSKAFCVRIGAFEVSYGRCSDTNRSPYFATSYEGFQNQDNLPHRSPAYQFYRKWDIFHCVEMKLDEYQEMMEDVKELNHTNNPLR